MTKLNIGGLSIEILGYQYHSADNYHDANWLDVAVGYVGQGTRTSFRKPCLMTSDLLEFHDGLSDLPAGTGMAADLASHEPNLSVHVRRLGSLGALAAEVTLRPETAIQSIALTVELDLSYLPRMIDEIDAILVRYPVRIAT